MTFSRRLLKPVLTVFFMFFVFPLFPEGTTWSETESVSVSPKIFRSQEKLTLKVPKQFEGRSVTERRESKGIELFDALRFERTEGKVQLHGLSTIFDFDYFKDKLDVKLFESSRLRPGNTPCMDCHGGAAPQTTLYIGREMERTEPKPVLKGNVRFTVDEGSQQSSHVTLNHWFHRNVMAHSDYKFGEIRQAGISLDCVAFSVGLGGVIGHRFSWDGVMVFSKTESYRGRKTFEGYCGYRLGSRLKLTFGGGAFIDGYTHFGTNMSEMGALTFNLERNDPQLMPTLFQRLKNDRFGYFRTAVEYEYPF
ncbi:hypothetical protein HYY75_10980 [bacterium]|nr:hypothetical protein [bacterium]